MAIPEHVKRQAMDAVNHRETTAMIRAAKDSGISVPPDELFKTYHSPKSGSAPISDDAKRKAMDAISHPEMRSQIRLASYNGTVTPPITPTRDTVHKSFEVNPGMPTQQQTMARDGFGRE